MSDNDPHAVIASVLKVFSRKAPISLLQHLFAPDVVCYMDRLRLDVGRDGLETWFRYMHARMRERYVTVDIFCNEIESARPGHYQVTGNVRTKQSNNAENDRIFSVMYFVENGKVQAVWSTKANYVGIVGDSVTLPLYLGFIYHCLLAWFYRASGAS